MCLLQQSLAGNQINSTFPGQEKSHGEPPFLGGRKGRDPLEKLLRNPRPWKCPKPAGGDTWGHGLVVALIDRMDSMILKSLFQP